MRYLLEYPYLLGSIFALFVSLLAIASKWSERSILFKSGIFCLPNAFFATFFLQIYWTPELSGNSRVNVEDFIWTFSMGILSFYFFLLFRRKPALAFQKSVNKKNLFRFILVGLACLALGLLAYLFSKQYIISSFLPLIVMSFYLGIQIREENKNAIKASLVFTLYHLLGIRAFIHLWPETRAYWLTANQIPFSIMGTPAYEVFWALLFGFIWPLAMLSFFKPIRE